MAPTNLRDRLARIPDLDADVAFRNLGGKLASLDRVMRTFALTYGDGLPALIANNHESVESVARSRSICHSLRGASTALGAGRVGAMALALECELRDSPPNSGERAMRRELHEAVLTLVGHVTLAINSRDVSELLWPMSVS